MDIRKKIIELHNKGITLNIEGHNLQFKAKQKVSQEDMVFLKENKEEIITILKGNASKTYNNNDEEYPLTDIQLAYLLGRKDYYKYGNVSSHVYFEVIFPTLEKEKVIAVWKMLINRHDNLRLVITNTQKQKVLSNVPELEIIWNENGGAEGVNKIRKQLEDKYYNVNEWPLFDVGVSQLIDKSIMHLSFDFLMLDWNSIWILLKEFENIYYGGLDCLKPVRGTFRDYCYQLEMNKCSSKYLVDEEYWLNAINTFYAPPMLPINECEIKNTFSRYQRKVNSTNWRIIKETTIKNGFTVTVVLLTAFSACVQLWSENNKFLLNLTTMNRNGSKEISDCLIGDFTSTSIVNSFYDFKKSFIDNAREIQKEIVKGFEHNLYTGMDILRLLRRRSNDYFLPVVFTSSIGATDFNYSYLELGEYGKSQTPQVFLDCQVMEFNKELIINWDVRDGVFSDKMLAELIEKYMTLLMSLADANLSWSELREIDLVNFDNNEYGNQILFNIKPLHFYIYEKMQSGLDEIAIIKGDKKTSYKELGEKVVGIERELIKLDVKKDEMIGIMMRHSATEVAAVLAILNRNATFVPLDYEQPVQRIKNIIEQSNIQYVLTDMEYQNLDSFQIMIINCEGLSSKEKLQINYNVSIEDLAYVIFTSGSTGIPKGVKTTHSAVVNTILGIYNSISFPAQPIILGLSKLNFDLSIFDIFGILGKNGTIVYPNDEDRINPRHWIELIHKHGINVWNTVPALMQLMINFIAAEKTNYSIELKTVLLSGDWIPVNLPNSITDISKGVEVFSLGGATEAAIWSIYHKCCYEDSKLKSIPYGKPLPNQKFYILNQNMCMRPTGVIGELYIAGASVAAGYLNDEERTAEVFIVHPYTGELLYKTGDFGRYLENGEIEFCGRRDNQIKINGYRIELGEIENSLMENNDICNANVIYDRKKSEQGIVAFVCPEKKNGDISFSQLDLKDMENKFDIDLNIEEVKELIRQRNMFASMVIVDVLRRVGFILDNGLHYIDKNINASSFPEKKQWIIQVWIGYLLRNELIEEVGTERYRIKESNQYMSLKELDMRTLALNWDKYIGGGKLIEYIENCSIVIEKCFRDEINPVDILYPEGSWEILDAIYKNNIFAMYFNKLIAECICRIGLQKKGKIRILEVGAGTGCTSNVVLDSLQKQQIEYEYYFTDIAKSFVATAKNKFKQYKNIKYKIFDMNDDYSKQGFVPNEFDVILAVGVFENAQQIKITINKIKEMLNFGGWLIFTEPIIEEAWILMSQIFMMEMPKDEMRIDRAYISQSEWESIVNRRGDSEVYMFPVENEAAELGGMKLFIQQCNLEYERLSAKKIVNELKERIPQYMLPKEIYILKEMPLTGNGKIDNRLLHVFADTLFSERKGNNISKKNEDHFENIEYEFLLKNVKEILGIKSIDINKNLYEYGADSLLMAQLAGKIRDSLQEQGNNVVTFDMLLRQLLNYPTVSELACFIDNLGNEVKETKTGDISSSIGKLTYFSEGKGIARVLLHAGFGTMNSMRYVIDELVKQNNTTVIGITIMNNEQYCKVPSDKLVATIGQEYAQLIIDAGIKSVQLIGYCLGGLIATEVARHLIEAGIQIVDIALIDSYLSPYKINDALISEAIFLPNFSATFGKVFPNVEDKEVMEVISILCNKAQGEIPENAMFEYVASNSEISDELRQLVYKLNNMSEGERFEKYVQYISGNQKENEINKEMLLTTFHTNQASWKGATVMPNPILCDVRLLLAKEKMDFMFADKTDAIEFWKSVCFGNFECQTIEGNHVTCAENKENAIKLSEVIRKGVEV